MWDVGYHGLRLFYQFVFAIHVMNITWYIFTVIPQRRHSSIYIPPPGDAVKLSIANMQIDNSFL